MIRIIAVLHQAKRLTSTMGQYSTRHLFSTKKSPSGIPQSFLDAFSNPVFTELTNRSLIVVAGPETQKFLQGITTNNVYQLYNDSAEQKQKRVAMYTLFLNPKGKVITDAIIIRPIQFQKGVPKSAQNQLWIDVSNQSITSLYEHLQRYTWKKKVNLINLRFDDDRPELHAGYVEATVAATKQAENYEQLKDKAGRSLSAKSEKDQKDSQIQMQGYQNLLFYDPRGMRLGVRMICGKKSFKFEGKMKTEPIETYQKMNRMSGISSSVLMKNKLPFMFNSDLFNGFSFNKGCYLGQEIVARAYFTGIVRRRVFPFLLENSSEKIKEGEILYGEGNKEIGKVIESLDGCGTVLVQYLPLMQSKWPVKIEAPVKGILQIPFWQQLTDYLKDMKEKQTKLQQIDL